MPKASEYDVVVVGAGAAGLIAAVEAADAGAQVCVLESEPNAGGSTWLSGAYVALCETDLQEGSREALLEDLVHSHHDDCQQDLSQLYVAEAAATWRRLQELDIHFVRTFQFAHMSRPWAHELSGIEMGGGAEIVTKLMKAANDRSIDICTDTRVSRLIIADHSVRGVQFDGPEGSGSIRARRGVIIATGGFTRNPEMIRNFGRPGADKIMPMTGHGSRGDGIMLGMSAGAGVSYMTAGVAPTAPIEPETGKGVMAVYAGAIAVNLEGKRFTRESDLYIDLCWAALQQPQATFAQIYDAPIKSAYAETMMGKVLTGYRELAAPSLPELAEMLATEAGFNAAAILETVAGYNSDVERGTPDAFDRSNLVGHSGALRQISCGPFYAAICRPGTTHFNGGLSVDTSMQVRNVFGEPIPGLYAAGEVTGGFHGAGYMSGTFVGMALIFGRVAGRSAGTPRSSH